MQGKARDVKQHRWFEGFDWEALSARKVPAPRKPRDDAAKRIRELAVRCWCCLRTHCVLAALFRMPLLNVMGSPCVVQESERKQRAQPKETPEEVAEAEAVFAEF